MSPFDDLPNRWRSKAAELRRYGADEAAATLEQCADDLEEEWRVWQTEPLTLDEAAVESGYSRSSFERWIASGEIPNAGAEGSPRVRRRDLPRKLDGAGTDPQTDDGLPDVAEEVLAGAAV